MRAGAYSDAGVRTPHEMPGFKGLLGSLRQSFRYPEVGKPALDFGQFANVLDIGDGHGLAIATDGVGTKLLIAQLMGKYDTVGIDCVAMNANDVVCVGARPVAMTDYVAVQVPHEDLLQQIGLGLLRGAELAGISIPGGEIAQVPEMLRGQPEGYGFDLAGTCVGLVDMDRILLGQDIQPGDSLVGLASSGIHSNGMTLARQALLCSAKYDVHSVVAELGRSVGEELLEPTIIYVPAVLRMLSGGLHVRALVHITSDGFLNLTRMQSPVGFRIDWLPEPPPVFDMIARCGGVPDEEMFRVFNMGIGFVVVVSPADTQRTLDCAREAGIDAWQIGECVEDEAERVRILPRELVGQEGSFTRAT